jgi:hypothetical protein
MGAQKTKDDTIIKQMGNGPIRHCMEEFLRY